MAKKQNPVESSTKNYTPWFILGGIVLVLIFLGMFVAGKYNGLVSSQEGVNEKWGNVQSAYQRRADLIPNLVETVKGAKTFEQETLTKITELRSQAGQAKIDVSKAQNPAELEAAMGNMNSVLSRLMVIVENYPQLKSNENFLSLQDEIAGTENRIKVERDNFNAAVKAYNVQVRMFPGNFVAGMFGFQTKEPFAAEAGAQNAPKVSFG